MQTLTLNKQVQTITSVAHNVYIHLSVDDRKSSPTYNYNEVENIFEIIANSSDIQYFLDAQLSTSELASLFNAKTSYTMYNKLHKFTLDIKTLNFNVSISNFNSFDVSLTIPALQKRVSLTPGFIVQYGMQ